MTARKLKHGSKASLCWSIRTTRRQVIPIFFVTPLNRENIPREVSIKRMVRVFTTHELNGSDSVLASSSCLESVMFRMQKEQYLHEEKVALEMRSHRQGRELTWELKLTPY
jgi:hypothetical protein